MLMDIEHRKFRPLNRGGLDVQHRLGVEVAKQQSLLFLCIGVGLVSDLRECAG
jgi:hypothetical protein